MATPTLVGALACQRNAAARQVTASVVSCVPSANKFRSSGVALSTGKKAPVVDQERLFDVVLSDTVLFPEGGGQPWDTGSIGGFRVGAVVRRGDTCVHQVVVQGQAAEEVVSALAPGAEVVVKVDWSRRWHHTQQHTAQHLLSAIIETQLGLPTTSWSMASADEEAAINYVQLPTSGIDADKITAVQVRCSELIAAATPVSVATLASKSALPPSRAEAIPEDVNGPIRVVSIGNTAVAVAGGRTEGEAVDQCPCCGTHTDTLAAAGPLIILHQERGKATGTAEARTAKKEGNKADEKPTSATIRLFFIAGERASRMSTDALLRERQLRLALNGAATQDFVDVVTQRAKAAADAQKRMKKLLAEVASLLAPRIAAEVAAAAPVGDKPVLFAAFREIADADFLAVVASAVHELPLAPDQIVILGGSDVFLIVSSDAKAAEDFATQRFCELVNGRGALNKKTGYFRGTGEMKRWAKAVASLGAVILEA